MQNILEIAELAGLAGLTFTLAAVLEWVLLQGIFRMMAARLQPPMNPVLDVATRKAQR